MEFKEISSYSYGKSKLSKPFCVITSQSDQYCLLMQDLGIVHQIKYIPTSDSVLINFHISYIKCPIDCPTRIINKKLSTIFDNATVEEKHHLMLNPTLIPDIYVTEPTISSARFSPALKFPVKHCLIAVLNNFGALHILQARRDNRDWEVLVNVSEKYSEKKLKDIQVRPCQSMRELQNRVGNILITAFCWKYETEIDGNGLKLAFVTQNENLIFCKLEENRLEFELEQLKFMPEVNDLKWFKFKDRSFILGTNLKGQIKLFEIMLVAGSISGCKGILKIWSDQDNIKIIHVEIAEYENNILILAIKNSHLLIFLIDEQIRIITSKIYYVGNFFISGFTKLEALEYIIGTFNGYTEYIKLTIIDDSIEINSQEIRNDNNSKLALYGMAISPNKAFWLFATYPSQPFDHLVLRSPINFTISITEKFNAFKILSSNPDHKLTNMYDCVEVVRVENAKNLNFTDQYYDCLEKDIEISDAYFYDIKLRMIALGGKCGYMKRRNGAQFNAFLSEYNLLNLTISSYTFYKNLKKLFEYYSSNNLLTELQAKAAKYLRIALQEYLKIEMVDDFEAIRESLHEDYNKLINDTDYLEQLDSELCVYCTSPLLDNKLICLDNHKIQRCCFSNLQVPLMNTRTCSQCGNHALDKNSLNEILLQTSKNFLCPLCDIPIGES